MKEFIYDNTFEGLLTTIFYAYTYKNQCTIRKSKDYIPSLFNDITEIKSEINKFNRVYNSIVTNLNTIVLRNVYYLYLSDIQECDDLVLRYLKLCYKHGVNINLAKNNPTILAVDRYCRRVAHEAHRFEGFVRFKEVSHLSFYASIEPDYNILPLILNHFTERFSDQNFIIHDLKRELSIIYNKKSAIITEFKKEDGLLFSNLSNDSEFQKLWKTFYKSVNIKERENTRLRKQYMPKRYWSQLTELQE